MDYDLFGLGNALVDALVVVDDHDLVARHELKRGTMHLVNDERWQGVYSEVRGDDVEMHPGGSCANAVSTAAHLGAVSTFCGLVGTDPLGKTYEHRLKEVLGGHHLVHRDEEPTGKCLSLISTDDAERTMLTDLGVSMQLSPKEVPLEAIGRARWLHVTGYLFTGDTMAEAALAALDKALQVGTRISVDLGDPFVIQHFRERVDMVIERYADLVFMNEEEAMMLADGPALDALRKLEKHVETVVLKLGKRGSLIQSGGQLVPIEAKPVQAVDTTGAGDAYAGGFLFGLTRGWDPLHCGRLASEVAGLTVAQVGGVVRDVPLLRDLVVRHDTHVS
jgi:sugar/nucleoside kinase (ribokinase family)